jgi:hypothetical protein
MQPLDLNLASNPFRNNTLLWTGYTTTTVLLLAFSVWSVDTFVEHRARLRELRDTVGTFESQRLDLSTRGQRALDGIRRFDVDALEVQAAKANEVIEWKAFSWTRLFNALEEAQPNQVRMTAVRPDFKGTSAPGEEQAATKATAKVAGIPVSIAGIAHDLAAFTALQSSMQEHPSFGRVEPNRLARTDGGEIMFEMHAWYLYGDGAPDGDPAADEQGGDAVAGAGDPQQAAPQNGAPGAVATASGEPHPAPLANGATPDVAEPWPAGQVPGSGEVESAAAPGTPPPPARKPPASKARLPRGVR